MSSVPQRHTTNTAQTTNNTQTTNNARLTYSIGDLARLGGVTVRMLRHYDDIGLLMPEQVDHRTAYRTYGTAQLQRLRRIVAFRELGFPLAQIGALLEESISPDQLRGMLRMRKSQIAQEIAAHEERLRHLEQLIKSIEASELEPNMSTTLSDDAVQRRVIPTTTVASCSAVAADFGPQHIGPVLSPLFPQLFAALGAAGVSAVAPPLSLYADHPAGGITVSAAAPIDPGSIDAIATTGLTVITLPAIDAVTTTHHGPMSTIESTYQALFAWITEHGLQTVGYSRELAVHCPPDQTEWITELQVEVTAAV